MALSFCCGAECGVNGAGPAVPSGTYKHWHNFTAGVTNVTTTVRTGSRAWQISPSAASAYIERQPVASQNRLVGRAYVRWSTLPNSSCSIFYGYAGGYIGVAYNNSTGKITSHIGSTYASTGVTAATGEWYLIEFYANTSANPWTVDVKVNGTALTQQTSAVAANTFTYYGVGNGNATTTMTMFADDIAFLTGSADLSFIGDGQVYGLAPDADGTHSFESGDFIWDAAGANVPTNSTTSNSYVSGLLDTTIGNFLNAAVSEASSPDYIEWTLPDLPVSPTTVNGVEFVAAYHSSGTGANNIGMKMSDGTNVVDIHGLIDISETTILLPSFQKTTAPDGGAWAEADVNALRIRWGYTTDANPDAYLNGVRAEVDVTVPSPNADVTPSASALITAVDVPTVSVEVAAGSFVAATYLDAPVAAEGADRTPDAIPAVAYLDPGAVDVEVAASAVLAVGLLDAAPVGVEAAAETSGAVTAVDAPEVHPYDEALLESDSFILLESGSRVGLEGAGLIDRQPDAVAAAALLNAPTVTIDVAVTPGATLAATFLSSATAGVGVDPDSFVAVTYVDQPTVDTGATPDANAYPDSFACIAVVDVPTVDVEAAAETVAAVAFLDAATALGAAEVTPDTSALTSHLDAPTVGVEAAPGAIAATTALDPSTADVGIAALDLQAGALLDVSTAGVGADPSAFAPLTYVDEPAVDTGGVGADRTPDPVACIASVDTATVGVGATSFDVAVSYIPSVPMPPTVAVGADPDAVPAVTYVDEPTVDTGGVGADRTPDASLLVASVDTATASIGADPVAVPAVALLDTSTVSIGTDPVAVGAATYVDTPVVETGLTAAIDLEDNFETLLEDGSQLLLQAGAWDGNVTPDPIGVVGTFPQCDWTVYGITISQTFAFPPYAFLGLASHADVFPLDVPAATFVDAPVVATGVVLTELAVTAGVDAPSVTTTGADGDAYPNAFVVGIRPVASWDLGWQDPQVSVGVAAPSMSATGGVDTPNVPASANVVPDAFVVRVPTAIVALESGSLVLLEDGLHLALEEGGVVPTVDAEPGGAYIQPIAVDVSAVMGASTVGQEVTPEVVMVLVDLGDAYPQVQRAPRRSTRRAILTWRTGRSRLT